MRKDLSKLEKQNAEKFNDVNYLHGFRFGVLEGRDEGYEQGKASGVRLMANAIKLYCIENNVRIAEAEIDNIENVICKSIQGE